MADAIRPITMPKWGIEMTGGTLTAWTTGEGQSLRKGEPLLEVGTEKIVDTVEAPFPGTLRRNVARDGEVRPVGSLLAVGGALNPALRRICAAVPPRRPIERK